MTARTNDLSSLRQVSHISAEFTSTFARALVPDVLGRFKALTVSQPELLPQTPSPEPYRGKLWVLVATLPKSRIGIVLPLYRIDLPVRDLDIRRRGILPDHPFEPTIADVVNGVDSELAYVRKLIGSQRPTSGAR